MSARVWKPFENPARSDGLVLHHWERKTEPPQDLEYQFAKFNVKVDISAYTDGEYEVLKDPDWTREETDYLFSLCREYDLRFIVIWDRYEFTGGKPRTVEDIKARYYSVCRSLMELRTPLNQMTPEETQIFNLLNFDKERETERKNMAEVLFARTPEQVKEEEMLLVELARITKNQAKNLEERKELFSRLEVPASQGSIAAYTGSQGLAHLREMMVNGNDKNKKRKSIAMAGNSANSADGLQQSPAVATSAERSGLGGGGSGPSQKDTLQPKKQVRKLTEEEELEFGVTYHDRLTPGVKFRSAMVAVTVKGGTAQKVQAALAQLEISPRLAMPTARTVRKFEQLQASVGVLLDARKANDKIDNEQRVLRAQIEAAKEDS